MIDGRKEGDDGWMIGWKERHIGMEGRKGGKEGYENNRYGLCEA